MSMTSVELERLPALNTEAIDADEAKHVQVALGRLRSPEKRLPILARIAADADAEAKEHRPRRNELLLWLRDQADAQGLRNIGLPGALGVMYTRAYMIVRKLTDDGLTADQVDPGTAPVGEFRDVAERVYRAEKRRAIAIGLRDEAIVKLDEKGLTRQQIHRIAGGVFDPSLISQVVERHASSKGQ